MIPEAEVGRAAADLAAVTDPEGMCPLCWSGEAIRQTSCTPRVEAWACDRCDTRWAITVVNPPLVDRIASAMAARSTGDEVVTVGPDLRAQTVRDDDSEPRGYFIGECGHRRPICPTGHVGACEECGVGR